MKYNTDMNLPEAYCKQMQELLGEEYTAYLAALEQPSMAGLRVNTGKVSVEEFLKISPFFIRQAVWVLFPPGAAQASNTRSPSCTGSRDPGIIALGSCR